MHHHHIISDFNLLSLETILFTIFNQAELFAETVLKVEGDDISIIEGLYHIDELRNELNSRKIDAFLSPETSAEKALLIDGGHDSDDILSYCNEFYGACFIKYINVNLCESLIGIE